MSFYISRKYGFIERQNYYKSRFEKAGQPVFKWKSGAFIPEIDKILEIFDRVYWSIIIVAYLRGTLSS